MIPKYHFILALPFSLVLSLIDIYYTIFFMFGAYLIDIDHYLVYIFTFKEFSIKKAINFFSDEAFSFAKGNHPTFFLPLHTIESFIAVLSISVYIPSLYFLFFGMVFHYTLDLCYDYMTFKKFIREFSIITYLLNPYKFSLRDVNLK